MKSVESNKQLFLATIAFAVAFAIWGLVSGLATVLHDELGLNAAQVSWMVAIPVLLGSLGRIPMGLLTDRYGGRRMFTGLLLFCLLPALALAWNHSYNSLLVVGFLIGLAGSSFAIGVAFVSLWFPPEKQGMALGVYGLGNMGQSVATFLGPVIAIRLGIPLTFVLFGLLALAWGIVFAVWARDAQRNATPKTLRASFDLLKSARLSWALSLFYFLTFGAFVAMGIYLPTLLHTIFNLTPEDAGARTAGFIILATLSRPVGGWLSDRIGGQRVLAFVFCGIALLAWCLIIPSMYVFTVGALGSAILLGLGNGGVFKLVPQYFKDVGTVTGLVGAAGGLGGFFPPIVLGMFRDSIGSFAPGFVLLSAFAGGCGLVLWFALFRPPRTSPGSAPSPHGLIS